MAKFFNSQICYIVAAIAFRDTPNGREVLLMQEAKESRRGQWYLPAGKVEPGETIEVCWMGLNKENR
jgi:8-oxo-dGDP phosphatase